MALYKRRKYWHYDFRFEGQRYQGSTRHTNKREAEMTVSAMKADLARRKFSLPARGVQFAEVCKRYGEYARANEKPSYGTE